MKIFLFVKVLSNFLFVGRVIDFLGLLLMVMVMLFEFINLDFVKRINIVSINIRVVNIMILKIKLLFMICFL